MSLLVDGVKVEFDKGNEDRLLVTELTNGDGIEKECLEVEEDNRLLYELVDKIPSLRPYKADAGVFGWGSKTEAVDADNNLLLCFCKYLEP